MKLLSFYKLIGVDPSKNYTEEEVQALRDKYDRSLRLIICFTFSFCAIATVVMYFVSLIRG